MGIDIRGLDHVQVVMPLGREAEARAFYTGVLGLREVEKPASLAARGGCWFEGPDMIIHVGAEVEFAPARRAHPALLVRDLAAARAHLAGAGAPLTPDDSLPDVRRFYTADPFGNRIEFIQAEDGFSRRGR